MILLDILRLEDAILVLDGIDECSDNDFLIESLVSLSHNVPSLRMMLLSRINVAALKSSVRANHIFVVAKNKASRDIHQFCLNQIQDMFEEELLPESCLGDTEAFADKLCIGADGMLLWTRLMVRCLRSRCITKDKRLDMINQIHFPEGLEAMYERIVAMICAFRQDRRGPSDTNVSLACL
jgi:hypothetical protein